MEMPSECLVSVMGVSLVHHWGPCGDIGMRCGCLGSALGIIPLGCRGGEWGNIIVP